MTRELLFAKVAKERIPRPKAGYWKLVGDGETVYALLPDGSYIDLGANSDSIDANSIDFSGIATSDPAIVGRVWSNGGVLMVSAG